MEFALISALQLSEGSRIIKERRIGTSSTTKLRHRALSLWLRLGYLYLAEMMPPDHELGLLLINTIRKVSALPANHLPLRN